LEVDPSVTDDIVRETFQGTIILRSFQGVLPGEGKQAKRAILADILEFMP
jgi:hypothetical protein